MARRRRGAKSSMPDSSRFPEAGSPHPENDGRVEGTPTKSTHLASELAIENIIG